MLHGVPTSIVFDRDVKFHGQFLENLLEENGDSIKVLEYLP